MPPTLYIKNALRLASLGIGDGTVYASGSIASANDINVSQKTFKITGLSIITDLGADADDKFNGHILYFPASKNSYHIVDWVAATDTVTTYENPASTDTGACEIRRALVCRESLAGNPAHFLADGQRYALWKTSGVSVVEINLPNLLDNGSFESGSLTPWVKNVTGGTTDSTAINATTPILGARDLKISKGDRTLININQTLRTMKKSRDYRLLFKARYSGVFTANLFEAKFVNSGKDVSLSAAVNGTISGVSYFPTLSSANTWHSVDVKAPAWDVLNGGLQLLLTGTFDVFIDEIYLFEKVGVGALLIFDGGGFFSVTEIAGWNCPRPRTGQVGANDNFVLATQQNVTGGDAGVVEFASSVYPSYTLTFGDLSKASEILLAEKWGWKFSPELPDDAEREEYDESRSKSRAGVVTRILYSKKRVPNLQLKWIDPVDVPIWKGAFKDHHLDPCHPFAAKWDGNWGDRPILFRSTEPGFSLPRLTPNYPDKKLEWEEVI